MYSTEDYVSYYMNPPQQSGSGVLAAVGTALGVAKKICDVVTYLSPEEKKTDDKKPVGGEDVSTPAVPRAIKNKQKIRSKKFGGSIKRKTKYKKPHKAASTSGKHIVCRQIKRLKN